MTFFQSKRLMSIVVPYQPHFPDMPPDTYTLWGYGLFIDEKGDYVDKPMAQCTGREILTRADRPVRLRRHARPDHGDDRRDAGHDSLRLGGCSARRIPEDRPLVIPEGARNFAFLGQFVELPEDVVFTVEYSVHCAMHAVYALFGVDKDIPPIYHGLADPKVGAAGAGVGLPVGVPLTSDRRQRPPRRSAGSRRASNARRRGRALAERRLGAAGAGIRGLSLGAAISPSRIATLRASLRARRMASAFSRTRFSDGFS